MKLLKNNLLLTHGHTEGGTTGSTGVVEVDPLSQAAEGINTDFPVLAADRLMEFTIKSMKCEKNEKGNTIVTVKVSTNKDATFDDGKPCRAGFSFNQTINLTPSEKFDIESVRRNAGLWMKATLGEARANEQFRQNGVASLRDNPAMYEGLVFTARTGIRKDKTGVYPPATNLTPVIPSGN